MKKIIPFILLIFALNSCGKAISKIAIDDRKEHIQTLQLNEGDKIKIDNDQECQIILINDW